MLIVVFLLSGASFFVGCQSRYGDDYIRIDVSAEPGYFVKAAGLSRNAGFQWLRAKVEVLRWDGVRYVSYESRSLLGEGDSSTFWIKRSRFSPRRFPLCFRGYDSHSGWVYPEPMPPPTAEVEALSVKLTRDGGLHVAEKTRASR